ncbi:MAG TPA: sugar phosphate nucleotidyltransferase [Iamia sp.]|nr:sugar phosphate nucleotidyltransferase [Iamia sp.]
MAELRVPTIILCGGRGTRISEVNPTIPKPLLPIGERPVLWHIMKVYAHHGATDFVLALGWLGEEIRRFFLNYHALTCDFSIELGKPDEIEYHGSHAEESWRVTCVDTGRDSLTATRVRRAAAAIPGDGPVMVTYGDSVGDVDIAALLAFHRAHGKLATVTAVRPPGRFGELVLDGRAVQRFDEKPQTSEGSINGGFMVFEREAIERFIPTDADVMLEREPMSGLARAGELVAFAHDGFWQPMDTPRERDLLERMWVDGTAPWRVWS